MLKYISIFIFAQLCFSKDPSLVGFNLKNSPIEHCSLLDDENDLYCSMTIVAKNPIKFATVDHCLRIFEESNGAFFYCKSGEVELSGKIDSILAKRDNFFEKKSSLSSERFSILTPANFNQEGSQLKEIIKNINPIEMNTHIKAEEFFEKTKSGHKFKKGSNCYITGSSFFKNFNEADLRKVNTLSVGLDDAKQAGVRGSKASSKSVSIKQSAIEIYSDMLFINLSLDNHIFSVDDKGFVTSIDQNSRLEKRHKVNKDLFALVPGDSGGALVCEKNRKKYLLAVNSSMRFRSDYKLGGVDLAPVQMCESFSLVRNERKSGAGETSSLEMSSSSPFEFSDIRLSLLKGSNDTIVHLIHSLPGKGLEFNQTRRVLELRDECAIMVKEKIVEKKKLSRNLFKPAQALNLSFINESNKIMKVPLGNKSFTLGINDKKKVQLNPIEFIELPEEFKIELGNKSVSVKLEKHLVSHEIKININEEVIVTSRDPEKKIMPFSNKDNYRSKILDNGSNIYSLDINKCQKVKLITDENKLNHASRACECTLNKNRYDCQLIKNKNKVIKEGEKIISILKKIIKKN